MLLEALAVGHHAAFLCGFDVAAAGSHVIELAAEHLVLAYFAFEATVVERGAQ